MDCWKEKKESKERKAWSWDEGKDWERSKERKVREQKKGNRMGKNFGKERKEQSRK